MGDRPAAVLMELGVFLCTEEGHKTDPVTANKIMRDRYVDDFCTGGTRQQVLDMVGYMDNNQQHNGSVPRILSLGGFKIKAFLMSGSDDKEAMEKLGERVLGYPWDAPNDEFYLTCTEFVIPTNKRSTFTISMDNLSELDDFVFTRRIVLSAVMGIYDPLGLLAAFTIILKMGLKRVLEVNRNTEWDSPLPSQQQTWWRAVLREAITASPVRFPRSIRPDREVGELTLLAFCDGSLQAFATVIYAMYIIQDIISVRLVASKARITPLRGMTVPRSELSGLVLGSRLLKTVVNSIEVKPNRVILMSDSRSVVLATTTGSLSFMKRLRPSRQSLG